MKSVQKSTGRLFEIETGHKKVAHYLSTTAAADQQSERCHELFAST